MSTSPITTHVLDTALGRPAEEVEVQLDRYDDGVWKGLSRATTNADGRVADLLEPGELEEGIYRLSFETGAYFAASSRACFYPYVTVVFRVTDTEQHHHVPLLLSPFGYSTYRGS